MNGLKVACCDAPGTGATAGNSFRPLYQEVPYRYTAKVPAAGAALQDPPRPLGDQAVRRPPRCGTAGTPSDALPPAEAFVCTLTHLDVQKLAAGEAPGPGRLPRHRRDHLPRVRPGSEERPGRLRAPDEAGRTRRSGTSTPGAITREQFDALTQAGRAQQELLRRGHQPRAAPLVRPDGRHLHPAHHRGQHHPALLHRRRRPEPAGLLLPARVEVGRHDRPFTSSARSRSPGSAPTARPPASRARCSTTPPPRPSTFPPSSCWAIKDFKLGSSALKLNPFEPSPPSVTVDIDWMAYGDIEANPYSARANAQRLPEVKPPTERNLRATVEIRPTSTSLTWKNIGKVPLNKDTQVATGSVKSASLLPRQEADQGPVQPEQRRLADLLHVRRARLPRRRRDQRPARVGRRPAPAPGQRRRLPVLGRLRVGRQGLRHQDQRPGHHPRLPAAPGPAPAGVGRRRHGRHHQVGR